MGNKGKRGKRGPSSKGSRNTQGPGRSQGQASRRGGKLAGSRGVGANQSPRAFGGKMMTGRRKIRENKIPLRYQPVNFVRANDYDPRHLNDAMIKDTTQTEVGDKPSKDDFQSSPSPSSVSEIPEKGVFDLKIDSEAVGMNHTREAAIDDHTGANQTTTTPIPENRDYQEMEGYDQNLSHVTVSESDLEVIGADDRQIRQDGLGDQVSDSSDVVEDSDSPSNLDFEKIQEPVTGEEPEALSGDESDNADREQDLGEPGSKSNSPMSVVGSGTSHLSDSEDMVGHEGDYWWGEEQEEDQMSDLDDEQIYALARMSDNLDNFDPMDYGDADDDELDFDEVMDELLNGAGLPTGSGAPPIKKPKNKPLSRRQQARKEARDEYKALSNFGRDPELWQRYPELITVRDVLNEIRQFVAQPEPEQIRFPPLDSNANWYVKQLAGLHGLATSAQGSGKQKNIICARTVRTGPAQDLRLLHKLTSRRSTFLRTDRRDSGKPKEKERKKKIRDGHVVGHEAAPVSHENFGHRLMTRMGWTQGSGLGRVGAGIIDPIPATVKLTKRGLGDGT